MKFNNINIELKPYCEDNCSYCVYVNGEHKWNLLMTCGCYPEQYDLLSVYDMSTRAYFRLRWGTFTVECPDCWGDKVYCYDMDGDGVEGCFSSQEEREREIINALEKVVEYYENGNG